MIADKENIRKDFPFSIQLLRKFHLPESRIQEYKHKMDLRRYGINALIKSWFISGWLIIVFAIALLYL